MSLICSYQGRRNSGTLNVTGLESSLSLLPCRQNPSPIFETPSTCELSLNSSVFPLISLYWSCIGNQYSVIGFYPHSPHGKDSSCPTCCELYSVDCRRTVYYHESLVTERWTGREREGWSQQVGRWFSNVELRKLFNRVAIATARM